MPDDGKPIPFPVREMEQAEEGLGDKLSSDRAGDLLSLNPRAELLEMALDGPLTSFFTEAFAKIGYKVEPKAKVKDPWGPIERTCTAVHGDDEKQPVLALLQVPKWLLEKGNMIGSLGEIFPAFEGRTVRMLANGLEVPHPSFELLTKQWNADARFVAWSHYNQLRAGNFPLAHILKLELAERPPLAVGQPDEAVRAAAETEAAAPPQVFFSYSHDDRKWLDRLRKQLKPLLRKESFKIWVDTQIKPGEGWREKIEEALASAKVAVLLVSENFLASDFISEVELPKLLTKAQDKNLTIIWMLLDECHWKTLGVKELQAAYHDENGKLVTLDSLKVPERKKALKEITTKIKEAAEA